MTDREAAHLESELLYEVRSLYGAVVRAMGCLQAEVGRNYGGKK